MQYRGGKARIAKRIIETLDKKYEYTRWVEPFAGMASLSRYTKAQDIYLNDLDINIYTFLKELHEQGWEDLPDFVSEDEFKAAVNLDPSLLKTFIKIGCSFGGGWNNGYARSKPRYGKACSYARNSKNACARLYEAWGDKNLTLSNKNYSELSYRKTDLICCDPPYKNTSGFKVGKFDSEAFFNWMRLMYKDGYQIVCSEYSENLPDDATVIWERNFKQSVGNNAPKTEIVFCFNG
jgi:site-specific DNA-adenine methylase